MLNWHRHRGSFKEKTGKHALFITFVLGPRSGGLESFSKWGQVDAQGKAALITPAGKPRFSIADLYKDGLCHVKP